MKWHTIKIVILSILFCCDTFFSIAQSIVTITEGNQLSLPCDSNCFSLHATYLNLKKADVYSVASIPFNPQLLTAPNTLNLADDSFGTNIPINFSFCYFNNTYTQLYVSRNGVITFNSIYGNSPCSFNTAQPLPFTSTTFPDVAIFGPFMDLANGPNASIKFKTIGNAPYRKFVLQYNSLPLFGNTCVAANNTFEIVLHETYNYVDMQITNKATCNSNVLDTINYATLGIQGPSGAYLTVTGRNASIWTVVNEGWRFAPTGLPDYTVSWLTSSGTIVQSNADSVRICGGSYPITVRAKYTKLCPAFSIFDTIIVDKYKPKIDSVIVKNSTCKYSNNGTVTIYATSINLPITYNVSGFAPTTNNVFNNMPADTFLYNMVDASGCSVVGSDTVFSLSKLKIKIDSTIEANCTAPTGAIYLSASEGISPYTWLWQNGSTLPYITNIYGDSFLHVILTDSLGCVDSTVVKTAKKGPIAIKDSIVAPGCTDSNGKIFIHIDTTLWTGPFTYLWSNGDTTQNAFNLTGNALYTVIVTDAFGCKKTTGFLVLYDSLPSVQIVLNNKPTCQKPNGMLTAIPSGGSPPYTYLWNNGSTNITNITADSGLVFVTITDSKGCTANALINIIDTLDMVVYNFFTNTKCNLNNGTASVVPTIGMAPYTYLWSGGQITNAVTGLAPGIYTVNVSDALNCLRTINITIGVSPPMTITPNFKNASCDTANGFINLTLSNATNPVQFIWNSGDTTKDINWIDAGIYTITATDVNGCISTKIITIINEGKPYAFISDYKAPLCAGDSTGELTLLAVSGVGPYKYSLDGINFTASPTLVNIGAGTYTLVVKDANSCINDTVIVLTDAVPITIQYPPINTLICYTDLVPNFVILTSGGYKPYEYKLDFGSFEKSNLIQNLNIGNHIIKVKDSIGCVKEFAINVPGPDSNLRAVGNQNDVACFLVNTGYLKATIVGGWPPYVWQWDNGKTGLFLDSLVKGKYILNIEDSKGCKVDQPFEIIQKYCCEAYLPNAFSPNGDNFNDQLQIIPRANVSEVQWTIFDRWGAKLFESRDLNRKWDGTLAGRPMPMETYFYYLKYKCSFDENYYYLKGEFVLVR
jgi:gliding motility-associated-like protein